MRKKNQKTKTNGLPCIQNVVSYAEMELEEEINLKIIAEKVEGSRFNRKRFPAVIIRKTEPRSTILCFKSGRIIVIGSDSEFQAEYVAKRVITDISKALNIRSKMKDFRITNIVANADLGFRLNIGKLCEQRHIFKNDNFPGVVYKTLPLVKSVLLFASGRVVFTGAKSLDSIDNAYIELKRRMEQFQAYEEKEE